MEAAAEAAVVPDDAITPNETETESFPAFKAELAAELAAEPWRDFQELTGDVRLLRFLRSREGDVALAAEAYRAHLEWRKLHGVDAIRQKIVDEGLGLDWSSYPRGAEVGKFFGMDIDAGYSRLGHLVQLDNMGLVEPEGIMGTHEGALGMDAFTVAFIYMLEVRNKLHDDLSREAGRMIRTYQVRDLEQTGVHLVSRDNMAMMKQVVALSQDNYPESMATICFVNAGSVFGVAMAAMRSMLAERTLARFLVINDDPEAELLKDLEVSSIQSLCLLANRAREKVAGQPSVSNGGGELLVPARWRADVTLTLAAGQTARWSWSVEKHDVGFIVDVLTDDATAGWVGVPVGATDAGAARVAGELTPVGATVVGGYVAKAACVVRMRWDNQHAWTRSKTVTYSVVVEAEPEPAPTGEGVDGGAAGAGGGAAAVEPEPAPAFADSGARGTYG